MTTIVHLIDDGRDEQITGASILTDILGGHVKVDHNSTIWEIELVEGGHVCNVTEDVARAIRDKTKWDDPRELSRSIKEFMEWQGAIPMGLAAAE